MEKEEYPYRTLDHYEYKSDTWSRWFCHRIRDVGGVNHIYVDNCTFKGTDIGLRFKTTRGRGGLVSDIYISNINMAGIVGSHLIQYVLCCKRANSLTG